MNRIACIMMLIQLSWMTLQGQTGIVETQPRYWIFLTENREAPTSAVGDAIDRTGLSERAILRREKHDKSSVLIHANDFPVQEDYLHILESMGIEIHVVSKWMNSVSGYLSEEQVREVESLPFVSHIHPVVSLRRRPNPSTDIAPRRMWKQTDHLLDYGASYTQNAQINVPRVHDLGITGRGVLIGVIDTGFDYHNRAVFEHLDVAGEYDFHWGDPITSNEEGDPADQHNHGTMVLSVLGGKREGVLIGPAYNASYVLAKTEWTGDDDLHIEEDHWIEAVEWLESLGVDIITSSLGYGTFVDGEDYSEADLDGNTSLITRAADMAAAKGVLVLNAVGNRDFWNNINFPSDGDSVVAVGAVNASGNLAYFSSFGPTADGRTKPDVVAMGASVYAVNPTPDERYRYVNGTSFSCPLAAGVCAQVMEAHPELTAMDIRDALRNTADRADAPDRQFGWGLVNALDAVFYHGMIFKDFNRTNNAEGVTSIQLRIMSRYGIDAEAATLYFKCGVANEFQSAILRRGSPQSDTFIAELSGISLAETFGFYVQCRDTLGIGSVGPVGAPDILYAFSNQNNDEIAIISDAENMIILHHNFPNPFHDKTTILLETREICQITLKIFNVMGQCIHTLFDDALDIGKTYLQWNGLDDEGRRVASGLYFCVVQNARERHVQKLILLN